MFAVLSLLSMADYNASVDGGHAKTIKMLIERGANPNSRGQFQRTPLYRAAFAGHLEAGWCLNMPCTRLYHRFITHKHCLGFVSRIV